MYEVESFGIEHRDDVALEIISQPIEEALLLLLSLFQYTETFLLLTAEPALGRPLLRTGLPPVGDPLYERHPLSIFSSKR
ncbi:hypothetical protein SDC9_162256 [bioreactor metagenome]|uniref:Uncharacterized protein n=1 Tax=bioreactor metagenome TaxID=1076179 RepID=A0A645FKJ0_9ZZZZ